MHGVFGICGKKDGLITLYRGLLGMQSRGQEYCGMATFDGETIKIRTHRGMVGPSFEDDLPGLEGKMGIGSVSSVDRQPILIYSLAGQFALCFDGFIKNSDQLRQRMMEEGNCFVTQEDAELLAGLISRDRDIAKGLENALQEIIGPCSLVVLTEDGIFAARGMHGWRPLAVGKSKSFWAIASESCAFQNGTEIKLVRDVNPGEIIHLSANGIETIQELPCNSKRCSFEWIYFARPNSIIDGIPVTRVRHNLGKLLWDADGDLAADVVAPVPFSGIMHAEGYHLASGLQSREVFLLPQYIRRTYIMPLAKRKEEKSRKLVPIEENVRGMCIVLVDDSIRSGITMRGLVSLLRDAGAKEVHVRIASPVSVRYCVYDRSPLQEEDYIARVKTPAEICDFIGADSLVYTKLEDIPKAIGLPEEDLCLDCFKRGF